MNSFSNLNKQFISFCYADNSDIFVCYNNIISLLLEDFTKKLEIIKNFIINIYDYLMNTSNELFIDIISTTKAFKNEYLYLYLYNLILVVVLIYLFYKLSRFNSTLTKFNNNEIVIVNKNHVYKIIKRLKDEISSLKEENNTLKNEREKYIQNNRNKYITDIPSNQTYDELERIKIILSSDDRAAKKICLLNNMLKYT